KKSASDKKERDNGGAAEVPKVNARIELIESRGYKAVYLPPYSLFLSTVEFFFWPKIKAGVNRGCLAATDSLSARITESTE
ncbi:hypothetical protein BCV72DRAFT_329400, partial [Rhizopus microsporus var. microsporus]